jgi:hypothetical protein
MTLLKSKHVASTHATALLPQVDLPKTADRKLLRVVNYLVQLAAGEGSAGTVVPFSTLSGEQLKHILGWIPHVLECLHLETVVFCAVQVHSSAFQRTQQ